MCSNRSADCLVIVTSMISLVMHGSKSCKPATIPELPHHQSLRQVRPETSLVPQARIESPRISVHRIVASIRKHLRLEITPTNPARHFECTGTVRVYLRDTLTDVAIREISRWYIQAIGRYNFYSAIIHTSRGSNLSRHFTWNVFLVPFV